MIQILSLKSKAKPFKSFSASQTITIKLIPTFYMMQGLKNIKSPWPPWQCLVNLWLERFSLKIIKLSLEMNHIKSKYYKNFNIKNLSRYLHCFLFAVHQKMFSTPPENDRKLSGFLTVSGGIEIHLHNIFWTTTKCYNNIFLKQSKYKKDKTYFFL